MSGLQEATSMTARTSRLAHQAQVRPGRVGQQDQNASEPSSEEEFTSITEVREVAKSCKRCPLWKHATQTVFGEGPEKARVIFVGEQPGDQEDIAGRPFVGPAGKVFNHILEEA